MIMTFIRALRSGASASDLKMMLVQVLVSIPVILIALMLHEMAHAFISDKLGDPTGRMMGRLKFNPKYHLDPIGTICMLLFGFGWAKPVVINTRNFKHPKRDMALSAFAGPVMNIILSFIGCFGYLILYKVSVNTGIGAGASFGDNMFAVVYYFFYLVFQMNIYLAIFNLLPVPPLDGSRLLYAFLPDKYYFGIMKYERIISIIIMVLLFTGILRVPLNFIVGHVMNGIETVCNLIVRI